MPANFALVNGSNVVVAVAVGQPSVLPDGCTAYPAPDGCAAGWVLQADGSIVNPNAPKAPTLVQLLVYANTRRKVLSEGAGPGVSGQLIPATLSIGTVNLPIDQTTRTALDAGALKTTLPNGSSYSISSWLLPTGDFVTLNASDILAAGNAVEAAFQKLFDAQNAVSAAIKAGTVTTTAQVDAQLAAAFQ